MEPAKSPLNTEGEMPSTSSNRHGPFYRRPYFWLIVLIIFILLIVVRCHRTRPTHERHSGSTQVVSAPARSGDVPVYLSALGTVRATSTITVRTQISGQLWRVLFKEGQIVKSGELIAEIDPRPYQAQLLQFEGQLTRDQALLANARLDLKRYQLLYKQNSVSQQVLATQAALVKQIEGTVKLDQGQVQEVLVNLNYSRITAPVTGRVGLDLVDPGNFVQPSDVNGIAVITALDPITVIFSIPEDNIPEVMQQITINKNLIVKVYDRQQNQLLAVGTLLAMDNQVDPTTGTVRLKALFKNDANRLFPNQFVNIKLLVTILRHATVVPTAAIQRGAQGTYLYLLNKDNTVSTKPISVGVTSDDYTVITAGVSPGQQVVVEGIDKLSDGTKVKVYNSTAPVHRRSAA